MAPYHHNAVVVTLLALFVTASAAANAQETKTGNLRGPPINDRRHFGNAVDATGAIEGRRRLPRTKPKKPKKEKVENLEKKYGKKIKVEEDRESHSMEGRFDTGTIGNDNIDGTDGTYRIVGCRGDGIIDGKGSPLMSDVYADGSGVHYRGCQCIRTDRPMEPLITARTFDPPPNDDDSIIRFNKYDYSGSIPGGVFIKNFPDMTDAVKDSYENMADLGMDDYPISADLEVVERLRKSNAVSVVTEMDYEIKHKVQDLISSLGGRPLHPICDAASAFWDELEHVVRVNIYRRDNPDSPSSELEEEFPNSWQDRYIPSQWRGYNIQQVAEAVHDEPPGYHQAQLIHKFLSSPEGLTPDYSIMPQRSAVEFISAVVRLYEMSTHFISYVSPHNFAAKWAVGRARPEEVVHAIVNGGIGADCVPSDLRGLIMANYGPGSATDLAGSYWNEPGSYGPDGTRFTAYLEGSPRHPSWPAMHSAASNISFWLQVVFNLTIEQQCEAMLVDYSVSYARSIAGVHYRSDNVDGLNMGKEIIRRHIPDYLHHKFDADEDVARGKADLIASRFDWNDYYPGSDAFEELCGDVLPLDDAQS